MPLPTSAGNLESPAARSDVVTIKLTALKGCTATSHQRQILPRRRTSGLSV